MKNRETAQLLVYNRRGFLSSREWPRQERWFGMPLSMFDVMSPMAAWFMVNQNLYFFDGRWTGGGEPEGAD